MDRPGQTTQDALLNAKIQFERKQFFFDLKENPRGRFLKITEDVGGRRGTIIIPTSDLEEFREILQRVINADSVVGPTELES